jgi:O-antigen/teichoic acid export membrane protein
VFAWLRWAPTTLTLALVQACVTGFELAAAWLVVRRRYPAVSLDLGRFDTSRLRGALPYGFYATLLGLGLRLSFQTDSIVIGALLGVGSIPYYAVASSLTVYFMEFVVGISAVVMPTASKLEAEGDLDGLRVMFLKWSKITLSLCLLGGVFLLVFGPRFLGFWIEPEFEGPSGEVLRILMLSHLVFLPARGVALPLLMGLGKPRAPTLAFLAAGALNLGLSVALAGPLGLAGVAWGTAIANVLLAVVLQGLACRELGVSAAAYLRYVGLRAAIGVVPVVALLLGWQRGLPVRDLQGLAAAGTALTAAFGAIWILFVFRGDPYVDLRTYLRRAGK